MSGTLTVGTSTITATYGDKSTTFNVIVTEHVPSREDLFGVFTDGYAIGKVTTGSSYPQYLPFAMDVRVKSFSITSPSSKIMRISVPIFLNTTLKTPSV